jgi:hypothetical protein
MIMYKYRYPLQILVAAMVLATLASCTMFGSGPSLAPTQDPAVIQATLDVAKTQAVQTVVADLTLNAPVATNTQPPTATTAPTNTLAPTSTDIPTATMAPTFTATIAPTATRTVILWTSTPAATSTPNTITCTLSEPVPAFGEDFKPNAPFDAAWTIKNAGSTNWSATEIDIRYLSGTKMHEGADLSDLPADVAANGSFRLIFDMVAPGTAGRYTETWALSQGNTNVCVMSITIDVVP